MSIPPSNHPIWKIAYLAVCLISGAVYMHVMYSNGFDPMKDGTLLAFMGGLGLLWAKVSGGSDSK